jgi:hypothetical protein
MTTHLSIKIAGAESVPQPTTAQNMHVPNVVHVSSKGFSFIDVIKSPTLQGARELNFAGRLKKNGIPMNCSGVTSRLTAIAILDIAALKRFPSTLTKARVAKVLNVGIGKIPPQTPTATARPI